MTRPADPELVALLLTQRLVEAEASPLKASEFWAVVEVFPISAPFSAYDRTR